MLGLSAEERPSFVNPIMDPSVYTNCGATTENASGISTKRRRTNFISKSASAPVATCVVDFEILWRLDFALSVANRKYAGRPAL